MDPRTRRALGDAGGELVAHVTALVDGVHRGLARRIFGVVPGSRPAEVVHDAVANVVHRSVGRGGRAVCRGAGAVAAALPDGGPAFEDRRGAATARAVANGIVGDLLEAQDNALAIPMSVRHARRDVELRPAALAAAHPGATDRVAVHLHGLTEDETAFGWRADDAGARHEQLYAAHGWTPVLLRYNSGRRISDNGFDLSGLLSDLVAAWPVPVRDLALVGHSMGALVAESALVLADDVGEEWAARTRHLVALGAPHHGAPLERAVHVLTNILQRLPETRSVATFLDTRSVGIKDLRHGAIDESWRGHDPDEFLTDRRSPTRVPAHVRLHAVGATLGRDADGRLSRVLGDLLVPPDSALGRRRRGWQLEPHTSMVVSRTNHFGLLHHPDVTAHLHRALA